MNESEFVAATLVNENNRAILARLPDLGLPDCWLVSGAVFQSVWNTITRRAPAHGIRDYDLFYFDPDTSWDAEDDAILKTRAALADLKIEVELRNQARVHLWYEQKFGRPYPPLTRSTDGIDRFLMPCAQVGIRAANGSYAVYAPKGFADIAAMIVRPNITANFNIDRFREKAERWQALWPEITILPG